MHHLTALIYPHKMAPRIAQKTIAALDKEFGLCWKSRRSTWQRTLWSSNDGKNHHRRDCKQLEGRSRNSWKEGRKKVIFDLAAVSNVGQHRDWDHGDGGGPD